MKPLNFSAAFIFVTALLCGCGKKDQQATQTVATDAGQAAAVTNQNPANATPAPAVDAAKALAETDAALKKREYEQAVASLLKLQQQRGLTEQQSEAVRNAQIRVQQNLAGAVAGGDPKAKAAAEMLRQANMHR